MSFLWLKWETQTLLASKEEALYCSLQASLDGSFAPEGLEAANEALISPDKSVKAAAQGATGLRADPWL